MVFPAAATTKSPGGRDRRVVERLVVGKHQRGAVHRPLEEPRRRHVPRGVAVVVDDFHEGYRAVAQAVALPWIEEDKEGFVCALGRVFPHRVVHNGDRNLLPALPGGEGQGTLAGGVVVRRLRGTIVGGPENRQGGFGARPVKGYSHHGCAGTLGYDQDIGADGDEWRCDSDGHRVRRGALGRAVAHLEGEACQVVAVLIRGRRVLEPPAVDVRPGHRLVGRHRRPAERQGALPRGGKRDDPHALKTLPVLLVHVGEPEVRCRERVGTVRGRYDFAVLRRGGDVGARQTDRDVGVCGQGQVGVVPAEATEGGAVRCTRCTCGREGLAPDMQGHRLEAGRECRPRSSHQVAYSWRTDRSERLKN